MAVKGGAAIPISEVTSGPVKAGPAIPVYGYTSAPSNRPAGAGPARPVKLLTDADLRQNGGAYVVAGDAAIPMYDAPAGMAVASGPAIPIYLVGGALAGSAVAAPLFLSAEVGNVDSTTIAVLFDQAITALNYTTGVVIKKNTVTQTISSGTRQANHALVYYVITVAVGIGDTVTIQLGPTNVIKSEASGLALADTGVKSVTNHLGYTQALKFNDNRNSQYLSLMR
jgi:hypothetical protein